MQFTNKFEEKLEKLFLTLIADKSANWEKPWLPAMQTQPVNATTGKAYSGWNSFVLFLETETNRYAIDAWLTFNQAKAIGVTILKGSSATPINFYSPCWRNLTSGIVIYNEQYFQLSEREKEEFKPYLVQKIYNVFNICQTDIKESNPEKYAELLEKFTITEPKLLWSDNTDQIDSFISSWSDICPIYEQATNMAFFSPTTKSITVPLRSQFTSLSSFCEVLFHEVAHSTKLSIERNLSYEEEELVAELTAAFIQCSLGLIGTGGTNPQASAYLNSWLSAIKGKELTEICKQTSQHVVKAVRIINEKIILKIPYFEKV